MIIAFSLLFSPHYYHDNDMGNEPVYTKTIDAVHLKFNPEAGSLLSLACKGRVLHGRHFTFKSVNGDTAITLVATGKNNARSAVFNFSAGNQCQPRSAKSNCVQIRLQCRASCLL